jgi:hypothetical protein
MSKKVTSRFYNYFPKFIYFYFLGEKILPLDQKLHNFVKKAQGI